MSADGNFHKWHHESDGVQPSTVFPDGCRDLLIVSRAGEPDKILLTDFDYCPRSVALPAGTVIAGFRLHPGAVVSRHALDGISGNPDLVEEVLGNELGAPSSEIEDAILALTLPGATVEAVSQDLGVSNRTLQRQFQRMNLPPPDYWRLLARARRAAGLLTAAAPLADIAYECGFSDQAHMTRAFTQWFGCTPAQARRNASVLDTLRQPALGNWTGEQISTR